MENPTKSTKSSKSGGVKRPMNSFLMFCKKHRAIVHEKHPHLDNRSVTKILGDHWARMKDEEKTEYKNAAKDNIQEFRKIHPDYKWYKPDSKFGQQVAPASEAPRVVPVPPEKSSVSQNSEDVNSSKHIAAIEGLSMLLLAGKERLPAAPKMIPINGQLGSNANAGNPASCGMDLGQLTRMMTSEHLQNRSSDGVMQVGEGLNRPLVFISSTNTPSGFPLGGFSFPVPFSVNSEHPIDLSQSASTRMNLEDVSRRIGSEPGKNATGFSENLPGATAGSLSFSTIPPGNDLNAKLLEAVLSKSTAVESGVGHTTDVNQIPALQLQNGCLQLQGGNLPYLFRSGVSMPGQLMNFSITTPTSMPAISTPVYQPTKPTASKPSSTAQPDRNEVGATRMYAPSLRKIMLENIIEEVYSKEKETEGDRTKEHFPKTKKQQASLPSSISSNSSIPSAADGGSGPSNILSSVRYFDTPEDRRNETSYSNKTSFKTKLERDSESEIGCKKLKTNDASNVFGISGAATKPAGAKMSQSSASFNGGWKAATEGSSSGLSKNQYQATSSAFSSMLMNGSTENTPFLKIIEGLITNSIAGAHFEEKNKIGYNPITFVETKTQSISSEKEGSNFGINLVKEKNASGIEEPSSQGLASVAAGDVKVKRHRKKKRDQAPSADGVAIPHSSATVTSTTGNIPSSSLDGSSANLFKIENDKKDVEMNFTSRTNDFKVNGDILGVGAPGHGATESNVGILYRKFVEEELQKRLFCNEKFEIPKKVEETAMGNGDEAAAEEGRVEMRKRKNKDEINNNMSLRKSKRCNRGKIYNELISQGVLNRKRSSSMDAETEDVASSPGLNESFTSNEGSPSQTLPINSSTNLIRNVDPETQMTSPPACTIDGPQKKTSAKVKSHNLAGPVNPNGPIPTNGPAGSSPPAGTAHHAGTAIPPGPASSVETTQPTEPVPRSTESAPPACITHLPAGSRPATALEKFCQQIKPNEVINLVDLRTHLEKLGRVHPSPEEKPVGSRKRKASQFPIFHIVRCDAQHSTSPADNKTNISTSVASSQIGSHGTKSSAVTPVPCNV